MRLLRPALAYFLIVFGAGFALAMVRIPLLVPRFGTRTAELLELPLMLAVILWASRRLALGNPAFKRRTRLAVGLFALALMLAAEFTVAIALGERSISQYLAGRDPVSGTAYLLCLLFFAVAPALWKSRPSLDNLPPRAPVDTR
jgi:hypothetical protein